MQVKKYFGIYRALVVDNSDPEKVGRIQVKVYPMMAMIKNEKDLPWAHSLLPSNYFAIPEKGDYVWVFFEDGYITRPVWIGICTHKNIFPDEFKKESPVAKVLKTKNYTILIGKEDFEVKSNKFDLKIDKSGNVKIETNGKIEINSSGTIKVDGQMIELGSNANKQLCNNLPNCIFTGAPHSTAQNVKV